jgi:O-antigen/teichoic acid export membrane protein
VKGLWARLVSASPRARIARGGVWMLSGIAAQQAASMISYVATARILGAAGFGEFTLVRSTTAAFIVLAASHLGLSATRYVAELRGRDPDRAGRMLGLVFAICLASSAASTVLFFAAGRTAVLEVARVPQLGGPLAIGSALIVLGAIGIVQIGALTGLEAFRPAAMQLALEGALAGSGTVAGAFAAGVPGAVTGLVLATAASCLIRSRLVAATCRAAGITIRFRGASAERRTIWRFVLPSWLYGVSTQPFEWLSRLLLARGPAGLVDVAIFSAAYAWSQALLVVPVQVGRAAMPILTERHAKNDSRGFGRILRETILAAVAFLVVAGGMVAAGGGWIMAAYGSAFRDGTMVLAVLVLASLGGTLLVVLRIAHLAAGRAWPQAVIGLIWGATLIGTFLAAGERSAAGLAMAHLVAATIAALLQFAALRAR